MPDRVEHASASTAEPVDREAADTLPRTANARNPQEGPGPLRSSGPDTEPRRWTVPLLFGLLALLVIGALAAFLRQTQLRHDLASMLEQQSAARALANELRSPQRDSSGLSPTLEDAQQFWLQVEDRLHPEQDSELAVAVRQLRLALEPLLGDIRAGRTPAEDTAAGKTPAGGEGSAESSESASTEPPAPGSAPRSATTVATRDREAPAESTASNAASNALDLTWSDERWGHALAVVSACETLNEGLGARLERTERELELVGAWMAVLLASALLVAAAALALLRRSEQGRRQLLLAHQRALAQATHDRLTGLWNHDAILDRLRAELERARRQGTPLAVILAELDGFHELHQLLGPERGDEILAEVAERLARLVRPYDTLGRLDHASFLLALPSCEEGAAELVARRLAEAVNGQPMEHSLGKVEARVILARTVVDNPRIDPETLASTLQGAVDRARATGRTHADLGDDRAVLPG